MFFTFKKISFVRRIYRATILTYDMNVTQSLFKTETAIYT